jgi:hypothetical protein
VANYPDGTVYENPFKDSVPHCEGVAKCPDGGEYEVAFKDGELVS